MANIESPRVCVIGAGIAGLTSARYLQDEGINFTVLEATRYVGGTWRYDHRVGKDENGLPVHTSMYKHLRTNLPKSTMELRGFPLPKDMPSFPIWELYYKYLIDYAKHFDLERHIQFLHYVLSVRRVNNVWKVKHKYIPTGEEFEEDYDYVIVGNGHFSKPSMPNIKGEDVFKGTIIHSHDYRDIHPYKDRRVLVVGAGPSGMDITLAVTEVCKTLVHSHHSKVVYGVPFPANYVKKPDIQELNETGVIFVDGTYEDIDDIIYCTGFEYYYPFLDESCGLTIKPQIVGPLYRFMVNVEQPTLMIMGLVIRACLAVALDVQSQYAAALIKGKFTLPAKEVMLKEWQDKAGKMKAQGRRESDIFMLDHEEDAYYKALTSEAGIDGVPPVLCKIRKHVALTRPDNLYIFREYDYIIEDDENFVRKLENE